MDWVTAKTDKLAYLFLVTVRVRFVRTCGRLDFMGIQSGGSDLTILGKRYHLPSVPKSCSTCLNQMCCHSTTCINGKVPNDLAADFQIVELSITVQIQNIQCTDE